MCNFYQTNNEILKLDPYNKKDLEYIQFNHYLCRKENIQRVGNDLDRGLFKISYATIIEDTGLSRKKIQSMIKWFEEKGIIKCIKKSTKKGVHSVYAYTSVYDIKMDTNLDTDLDTNLDTDLSSISNKLNSIKDTNLDTDLDTNLDTSKKEKKKEKKKINIEDKILAYTNNEKLLEALRDFISMRKEIKKPMTDVAITRLLNKLNKLSEDDNDKVEILGNSIINSWSDVYELKNKKTPAGTGVTKKNTYKSSIYKTNENYTQKIEGSKFI